MDKRVRRLRIAKIEEDQFPVWDVTGTWQVGLDSASLAISPRLRYTLERWGQGPVYPTSFDEWNAEGQRLARQVSEELGPGFEVVYFDAKRKVDVDV
jgi:hypothetical protein